jgi:hypothetical protein
MSEEDIQAGSRWNTELERELAEAIFGISCMTPSNLREPWILFEAGALATKVKKQAFLCPYLIDLEPNDLEYPLAQFQARKSDKTGTLELLRGINSAIRASKPDLARADEDLEEVFKALWPQLEKQLNEMPPDAESQITKKDPSQLAEESWEMLRSLSRSVAKLEERISAPVNYMYNPLLGVGGGYLGGTQVVPSGVLTTSGFVPAGALAAGTFPMSWTSTEAAIPAQPEIICFHRNLEMLDGKNVPETEVVHYDFSCKDCGKLSKQVHRAKAADDEKEYVCPPRCPFHRGRYALGVKGKT